MKICANCRSEINFDDRYCSKCGKSIKYKKSSKKYLIIVLSILIILLPVLIFGKDKILINYYLNKANKEESLIDSINNYSKALDINYRADIIITIGERLNNEDNIKENISMLKLILKETDLNKVVSNAYINDAEKSFEIKEYLQSANALREATFYNFDEKRFKYYDEIKSMDVYEEVFNEGIFLDEKDYTEESLEEETLEDGILEDIDEKSYLIIDSDLRYLTVEELESYNKEELAFIRNEIFARHGYIFSNEKYNSYFLDKEWYVPDPNFSGLANQFNQFEVKNISLIKSLEQFRN